MAVATPLVKRRQQVLKPRGSLDINITPKPLLSVWQGQHWWDRHWRGPSVRPGSRTGAKARDGLPGNLRAPTHVHTMSEPGKRDHRLNNDPGPMRSLLPHGSAAKRARTAEVVWDPEANQISPGSQSTLAHIDRTRSTLSVKTDHGARTSSPIALHFASVFAPSVLGFVPIASPPHA